jgi:hypothetical protein
MMRGNSRLDSIGFHAENCDRLLDMDDNANAKMRDTYFNGKKQPSLRGRLLGSSNLRKEDQPFGDGSG